MSKLVGARPWRLVAPAVLAVLIASVLTVSHDHNDHADHEAALIDCAVCLATSMTAHGAPPPAHCIQIPAFQHFWRAPVVIGRIHSRPIDWPDVRGPPYTL